MTSEDKILDVIISEFPHRNREISELFEASSSFIEICEDYVLCMDSIKHAESLDSEVREQELIELRIALMDLKEELLSKLTQ